MFPLGARGYADPELPRLNLIGLPAPVYAPALMDPCLGIGMVGHNPPLGRVLHTYP